MKDRLFFVLLAASILPGCGATGRLYPVRGPLSAQTPAPVLVAKLTGAFNSGNISVVLADGEVCKGRWATVSRPRVSSGSAAASAAPAENMSSEWDTVYGTGFYVSRVLGARLYAHAQLQGDRGSVLDVEMWKPEEKEGNNVSAIKGVAKDTKDNIYKLAF
jgi:hypothetical protein